MHTVVLGFQKIIILQEKWVSIVVVSRNIVLRLIVNSFEDLNERSVAGVDTSWLWCTLLSQEVYPTLNLVILLLGITIVLIMPLTCWRWPFLFLLLLLKKLSDPPPAVLKQLLVFLFFSPLDNLLSKETQPIFILHNYLLIFSLIARIPHIVIKLLLLYR